MSSTYSVRVSSDSQSDVSPAGRAVVSPAGRSEAVQNDHAGWHDERACRKA